LIIWGIVTYVIKSIWNQINILKIIY
jgi:hypothetical protein